MPGSGKSCAVRLSDRRLPSPAESADEPHHTAAHDIDDRLMDDIDDEGVFPDPGQPRRAAFIHPAGKTAGLRPYPPRSCPRGNRKTKAAGENNPRRSPADPERVKPRNVDEAFGQGQSKQALDPEPTAQLVRHVIGEQEQDGTHGDPREGRHLGKQGRSAANSRMETARKCRIPNQIISSRMNR